MVRAPTLRTKAAEEWYKSSEQGAKATAEPAAPRVAREVDSKSDVKGTPGGAAGLGAARPPVYAMPSQGQAQQAAPHLIAHGAGRFVIRRLDPSAPLPPRPKGPPPAHLVAARPMMMARPPHGYGSQSAYQQPQMPPPITFQDQKQVSGYERADGAGDGMDDSSSWAGGAEGKDDYFRDRPPSIWSEYWDEEVDASYYYNKLTGEATWIKPADFDGEADYFVSPEDGSSTIDLSGVGGENSVEG